MNWIADCWGALLVTVILEFMGLFQQVEEVTLQPDVPDTHIWRYSTSSAYAALFQGVVCFEPAERIWKTWAPGKCKFLMWLVQHNRCWTTDTLARRSMDHQDCCPLCDQQEETINHLLLSCVFARQFWGGLLRAAQLQELVPQAEASFEEWWRLSSQRV
jgi:hypothetical protein